MCEAVIVCTPGGGGGAGGKDPPFLPDPHIRPPPFRAGPAPKTVSAHKTSLFQPVRTPPTS